MNSPASRIPSSESRYSNDRSPSRVTNQQTAVDQVPVLGSVPLLGNLFKHTTVSSTSKELLFFLTPRILPS